MKKLTLILIFLCCAAITFSQDMVVAADTTVVSEDYEAESGQDEESPDKTTNQYERKYINEASLEALRKRKEFRYPDLENDTLRWQRTQQTSKPTDSGFSGIDASVLLWLIVAVAAILVILQLAGVNMRQLFAPTRLAPSRKTDNTVENIHEISFDEAISQAIGKGDFSRATRLLYLQSLKLLSDKKHIAWHENKTNWQYVYEIKTWEVRDRFKYLTSVFEFVHYGHMAIDENRFKQVLAQFQKFKTSLA